MSTADELMAVIRMYAKNPTRHNEFKVRATLTDFLPYAAAEPIAPASECAKDFIIARLEGQYAEWVRRAAVMEAALRTVMRMSDEAKEPCGMDQESPAAIRNGKFASIAQVAAQGLGWVSGPPLDAAPPQREAIIRAAVAAMPNCNPGVADDLIEGHSIHMEADDLIAVWEAARALNVPRGGER